MAITYRLTRTDALSRGPLVEKTSTWTSTQTAGGEANIDEAVTDGAEQLVAYELDISQAKMFMMWSQGGNMTVKTNSDTVPDDTISLVDGETLTWTTDEPNLTIPLTADVTALYVTNTGTATLKIRCLYDPTV